MTTTPTTETGTITVTRDQIKPGWKTTEFWLSTAAKLLGVLFASGVLGTGTAAERIAGLAAALLASQGYAVTRAMVKSSAISLLLLGALQGCHSTKVVAGERTAIACGKELAPKFAGEAIRLGVMAALNGGHLTGTSAESEVLGASTEYIGCALLEFKKQIAEITAPPPGTAVSALSSPNAVNLSAEADALLAKLSAKWGLTWTD